MIDTVVVSGWHSGPNPSPGLGIARSIRMEFPDAHIIAVDYSLRSTGLYDAVADEVIALPKWSDIEPQSAANELLAITCKNDAVLISGLDLETSLLAPLRSREGGWRLLVPPCDALNLTEKPAAIAAKELALSIPLTASMEDAEQLNNLIALCGWPLAVKGRRYESFLASSVEELSKRALQLMHTWSRLPLVQEFISGTEHSIAFAAYEGELLGASAMTKTEVTAEGKTWCGNVGKVDEEFMALLEAFVRLHAWTGGGEIEMVRSTDGRDYLIDFNQRFPAWIFGASLNGINLPAILFARAANRPYVGGASSGGAFVRVVSELPSPFRAPNFKISKRIPASSKGHPSGMPALSTALSSRTDDSAVYLTDLPAAKESAWLEDHLHDLDDRPMRLFDKNGLCDRIGEVKECISRIERSVGIPFVFSYSVKTNPSECVLQTVSREGLCAECISLAELVHATRCGFEYSECTLNGPGKWWPSSLIEAVYQPACINCDSIDDVNKTIAIINRMGWDKTLIGLRLSAPGIDSRFGIDLMDLKTYYELSKAIQQIGGSSEVGMHFHYAQSTLGAKQWIDSIRQATTLMAGFIKVNGLTCTHVDLGGGWRSQDMKAVQGGLEKACRSVVKVLPEVEHFQVEFGKLLVEGTGTLVCRVLARREGSRGTDLVVSSALCDLPDACSYPHRALARKKNGGPWVELPSGRDRLLGRICMEADVLRTNIAIPKDIQEGDLIAICDAGAYDASMSYSFGEGVGLNV